MIQPIILIPTRDRSKLLLECLASIRDQKRNDVPVVVSDNSSSDDEASLTRDAFDEYANAQCDVYLRPKDELAMGAHWNWALEQVLKLQFSHVLLSTDRMVFKRGALSRILSLYQKIGGGVLTYNHDTLDDSGRCAIFRGRGCSQRLYCLIAERVLKEASMSRFWNPLPRLMNCIVPLTVCENMRSRFGSVCNSKSPDLAFAFRVLSEVEEYHYYDGTPVVYHGLFRSNGYAAATGRKSRDHLDFSSKLGHSPFPGVPAAGCLTVVNAMNYEYVRVRAVLGEDQQRFPPVDFGRYVTANIDACLQKERVWTKIHWLCKLVAGLCVGDRSHTDVVGKPILSVFCSVLRHEFGRCTWRSMRAALRSGLRVRGSVYREQHGAKRVFLDAKEGIEYAKESYALQDGPPDYLARLVKDWVS